MEVDFISSYWEGIDFNKEIRVGFDCKYIWEIFRNNCIFFCGGDGSIDILLVRDNELVKFGVFVFMWFLCIYKRMFGMIKYEMYVILFIIRVVIINCIVMILDYWLIRNNDSGNRFYLLEVSIYMFIIYRVVCFWLLLEFGNFIVLVVDGYLKTVWINFKSDWFTVND